MIPIDLLTSWPLLGKASVEDVISSPAYAMPCKWPSEGCSLSFAGSVRPVPAFGLVLRFANEEQILGLPDTKLFPTLNALSSDLSDIPDELVLAALEKDAGGLFALLEDASKRQVQVAGLVSSGDQRFGMARSFQIKDKTGVPVFSALMTFSPAMVKLFGDVKYLDLTNPVISDLALDGVVEYARFNLSNDEINGLSQGDMILLPELKIGADPWKVTIHLDGCYTLLGECSDGRLKINSSPTPLMVNPDDLRVISAESIKVSFGQVLSLLAKGGAVEKILRRPAELKLVRGERMLAQGCIEQLGQVNAMALQFVETITP